MFYSGCKFLCFVLHPKPEGYRKKADLCFKDVNQATSVFSNSHKNTGQRQTPNLLAVIFLFLAFLVWETPRSWANPPVHPGNNTIVLPSTVPSNGYNFVDAFPSLTFYTPVGIFSPPNETNRLFVVELKGTIYVITNLAVPTKTVFMDLADRIPLPSNEAGILGLAFHPGFATNQHFFLFYNYTTNNLEIAPLHERISRFTVDPNNSTKALFSSEVVLIDQFDRSDWHNGGHIEFGPDGYLYFSNGDEGVSYDWYKNSQFINRNFFGGIFRIDVDKRPGNLLPNPHPASSTNYFIPADNPFVNATHFNGLPIDPKSIRTELFATGLRNAFGFSIDPLTGDLYANDTGQELREEVNYVPKGANHGWSGYEGNLLHTGLWKPEYDAMFYTPPLLDYPRDDVNLSIAGGIFYRGNRYAGLSGSYLFCDFWGGSTWATRFFDTPLYNSLQHKQRQITQANENLYQLSALQKQQLMTWASTSKWSVLKPNHFTSENGTLFEEQPDSSLLATGPLPNTDIYEIISETTITNIRCIRLDAYVDPRLPDGGPGRDVSVERFYANFVLTDIIVEIAPLNSPDEFVRANLSNATATFNQDGFNVMNTLDGNSNTGWAISPQMQRAHAAILQFSEPVGYPEGTRFRVKLEQKYDSIADIKGLLIGRFRLAVASNPPSDSIQLPAYILTILNKSQDEWTTEDLTILERYYAMTSTEKMDERNTLRSLQLEHTSLIASNQLPFDLVAADTSGITTFWIHPVTEEIYAVNLLQGKIKKLVESGPVSGHPLPPTLADTGIFSDLLSLTPHAGIIPYEINTPFWSDHAEKYRWFSVPDPNQLIGFDTNSHWQFPTGTVWIKHFELDLERGNPASRRRIETRAIVRNDGGVYGVTYRWDDTQTNAYLVPEAGTNEVFQIVENGQIRNQTWRYPSRSECLVCHSSAAGFALGFDTAQLNRTLSGNATNQLDWLKAYGYFSSPEEIPSPATLPKMAHKDDGNESLQNRVKSYLDANCAQCHRPGGAGRGAWDARYELSLEQMNLIDAIPLDNIHGAETRLVKPGSLEHSVLYHRLAHMGDEHMPPLATSVINDDALKLLARWILTELPHYAAGSNLPPTVSLSVPTNRVVRLPANITFQVAAADSDGTITNIQVRANATSVGNTSTRPFTVGWTTENSGFFEITATAQDNDGATVTSEPFNLLVVGQGNDSLVKMDSFSLNLSGSLSLGLDPLLATFAPVLEASSDLNAWTPIATNLQHQTPWVINDPNPTGASQRFYRISIPNQ